MFSLRTTLLCFLKDTINALQLFIFTNVIRCSKLPLWVGYFIYLKFTCVSSIVYQSFINGDIHTGV